MQMTQSWVLSSDQATLTEQSTLQWGYITPQSGGFDKQSLPPLESLCFSLGTVQVVAFTNHTAKVMWEKAFPHDKA